jgi:hypothetical protein
VEILPEMIKSAYAHGYESYHLAALELHISNKQQVFTLAGSQGGKS